MEQFWEETVTKRGQGLPNFLYILSTVLCAAFGAFALMLFYTLSAVLAEDGFGGRFFVVLFEVLLLGGCAVLLFFQRDKLKTDYDYTFTAGQMDFAQVFNNKKRKALGTMNLRNLEACGLVSSGSFRRYISMPGIRRTHWFLNRDAELLYFYFQKEGQKRIIIIEPSEKMVGLIKSSLAPGVWQNN